MWGGGQSVLACIRVLRQLACSTNRDLFVNSGKPQRAACVSSINLRSWYGTYVTAQPSRELPRNPPTQDSVHHLLDRILHRRTLIFVSRMGRRSQVRVLMQCSQPEVHTGANATFISKWKFTRKRNCKGQSEFANDFFQGQNGQTTNAIND